MKKVIVIKYDVIDRNIKNEGLYIMKIRNAKAEDINRIVELWYEMMLFHVKISDIYKMKPNAKSLYHDYVKECIHDSSKEIFLYENNHIIGGYIFVEITALPPVYEESRIGVITEIGVNSRERRSGIGKLLLDKAEDWLTKQDIHRAECTVSIDNPVSQSFWKNNGYNGYNEMCYKYL